MTGPTATRAFPIFFFFFLPNKPCAIKNRWRFWWLSNQRGQRVTERHGIPRKDLCSEAHKRHRIMHQGENCDMVSSPVPISEPMNKGRGRTGLRMGGEMKRAWGWGDGTASRFEGGFFRKDITPFSTHHYSPSDRFVEDRPVHADARHSRSRSRSEPQAIRRSSSN